MINKILFFVLVISIGGVIQRGVPVLSLIGWPVYKTIVCAISVVFFFRTFWKSHGHITPIKWYTLFVLLCVIWALFSGVKDNLCSFSALVSGILPLYAGYYFVRNGIITNNDIKISLIFFLIVAVMSFWGYKAILEEIYGERDITNNMGYYFVSTIPLLYMIKRKFWCYVPLLIIFVFVVLSAKRGAILCTIVGLFVYLYYQFFYKKRFSSELIIKLSFLIAFFAYVFSLFINEDSYVFQRINDTFHPSDQMDIYSGRDEIYASLYGKFIESDFLPMIIGHGPNGTVELINAPAHNDWLEILIDYGLIGALLYLLFFITSFIICFSQKNDRLRFCSFTVILMLLMQTIFSMGFTSLSMSITSLVMGCVFGMFNKKNIVLI